MHYCHAAVIGFVLLALPAAGELRPDGTFPLATAAAQLKLKNYSTAASLAAATPASGQRDLILGMAALHRGKHEDAAALFGSAAKSYPLLGDYALHYQAQALHQAARPVEALQTLRTLDSQYPESPLNRRSLRQQADLLYANGNYADADSLYQKFVEKYAAGSDALHASYRSALCREQRGDLTGAVKILRSLWLNSPASLEATRAEQDLQRLAAAGAVIPAPTPQELYRRGCTLYDQRHYDAALKTLRTIVSKEEKREFNDRLQLKIGQTLLKARRYLEAEQNLKEVATTASKVEIKAEAAWQMARAIEKSGRDEEAFGAYTRVAEQFPESGCADDALLDAAFIRKFQNRPTETIDLLAKLLAKYPKTPLKQRIVWESGWGNYLAGRYQTAAESFGKLGSSEDYRERALFWQGRSLAAAGDQPGSAACRATLLKEFPFGYYAQQLRKQTAEPQIETLPRLSREPLETLPPAEGYERVKALIQLGMIDDAATELAAARKRLGKGKTDAGLARLYLEIGNYNAAMSIYRQAPANPAPDDVQAWSLLFPRAFREFVTKYTEQAGIEPSLAYAVMRAESAFMPEAKSPVGARGLMQLMPDTAATVLRTKKIEPERLYNPELNIRLGSKHLRELIDKYNGNRIAVIASYNAGAHNVNRWLKTYAGLPEEVFIESIPFGETREYVKKVLAATAIYQRLYGMP